MAAKKITRVPTRVPTVKGLYGQEAQYVPGSVRSVQSLQYPEEGQQIVLLLGIQL
jgi:hypothetical protein